MFSGPPPDPIFPKGTVETFADISPVELARQITIVDHELFAAIEPKECLKCVWSGKHQKELAPNILAMIDQFNRVSMDLLCIFVFNFCFRIVIVLLLLFLMKKI